MRHTGRGGGGALHDHDRVTPVRQGSTFAAIPSVEARGRVNDAIAARHSPASHACFTCNRYLCKGYAESHKQRFREHNTGNISITQESTPVCLEAVPSPSPNDWMCELHDQEAILNICKTCSEPVCFICSFLQRHAGHNIQTVTDAFDSIYRSLGTHSVRLSNEIQSNQASLDLVEDIVGQRKETFLEQRRDIEISSVSLEEKSEFVDRLTAGLNRALDAADLYKARVMTTQRCLKKVLLKVSRVINDLSDIVNSENQYVILLLTDDSGKHAMSSSTVNIPDEILNDNKEGVSETMREILRTTPLAARFGLTM